MEAGFCFFGGFTVDERVEELPVEDVGYIMTNACQPSIFQTIKLLPQHEVEEETMMLDTSAQKLMLEVNHICIEDTLKREKQSKNDISIKGIC